MAHSLMVKRSLDKRDSAGSTPAGPIINQQPNSKPQMQHITIRNILTVLGVIFSINHWIISIFIAYFYIGYKATTVYENDELWPFFVMIGWPLLVAFSPDMQDFIGEALKKLKFQPPVIVTND